MMRGRLLALAGMIMLAGCGGGGNPPVRDVSRHDAPIPSGLGYAAFRALPVNAGDDYTRVQKRFVMLDRDNNGRLTKDEYSDY